MSLIYKTVIRRLDKIIPVRYNPLWNHPAGPKTIFFWAPICKMGLVAAGLSDLRRPADQLSVAQSASLAATGLIWSRYCLVIIPKNYALCGVNALVALTQLVQMFRAISSRLPKKDRSYDVFILVFEQNV